MSTQAGFELLLTKISEQGGPTGIMNVATSLGLDGSDYEHAVSTLISHTFPSGVLSGGRLSDVVSSLMQEYTSLSACDGMLISILQQLNTENENAFVSLMATIPDINYLFYDPTDADGSTCDLNLTPEQLASDLSINHTSETWASLLTWTTESDLINYYKTNEPPTFLATAIKFQYTLLAPYQETHNLYGGAYGGLENYFVSMRSYFGQTLYDQLTEGFLKQSSTYKDSMNLTEWHMYGSSRLGIYQTKLNMAYRSVKVENGVTTQVSTTSISYASYSYFPTERGAKRYELSNHLGNVLVVISDKKIPICSNNLVTFYKADVVSATDYSAFGAPLAERSWQASEYRFGFNGKEVDNETFGDGNEYDYGFRIYNPRLGKFLSVDPLTSSYPWYTPYQFAGNKPIEAIDLDGLEEMKVTTTSNPSIGKPGESKITITMHYTVVTTGAGEVTNHGKINKESFHSLWAAGNTTLFLKSLPSADAPAQELEGKYARWANKAYYKNSYKHQKKLKDAGVQYFNASVQYDYSISIGTSVTIEDASGLIKRNPKGEGIIFGETSSGDISPCTGEQIALFNSYAKKKFDPYTGGAGANEGIENGVFTFNMIVLNSKFQENMSMENTMANATEMVVHETGHNASSVHLHSNPNYTYDIQGLSSNKKGQIFPTWRNTMDIINDSVNRSTIK